MLQSSAWSKFVCMLTFWLFLNTIFAVHIFDVGLCELSYMCVCMHAFQCFAWLEINYAFDSSQENVVSVRHAFRVMSHKYIHYENFIHSKFAHFCTQREKIKCYITLSTLYVHCVCMCVLYDKNVKG